MPVERRVEWTDAARADLRAIVFYIAQDDLQAAFDVADRLEGRAATLSLLSTRGRLVPELRDLGYENTRELIEAPWRIIYRLDEHCVYIHAVVDGRRDLRAWLREQGARFEATKPQNEQP